MTDRFDDLIREALGRAEGILEKDPSKCPDEETLAGFYEGVLTEDQRGPVLAHLADCPDCRQTLSLIGGEEPVPRALIRRAQALVRPKPPSALDRVRESYSRLVQSLTLPRLVPAALAAVVLVVIGFQYLGSGKVVALDLLRPPLTGAVYGFSGEDRAARLIPSGGLSVGTRFQIALEAPAGGYLYVLARSRDGKLTQLYPAPDSSGAGRVEEGARVILPSDQGYFEIRRDMESFCLMIGSQEAPPLQAISAGELKKGLEFSGFRIIGARCLEVGDRG